MSGFQSRPTYKALMVVNDRSAFVTTLNLIPLSEKYSESRGFCFSTAALFLSLRSLVTSPQSPKRCRINAGIMSSEASLLVDLRSIRMRPSGNPGLPQTGLLKLMENRSFLAYRTYSQYYHSSLRLNSQVIFQHCRTSHFFTV